MIKVSCSQCGHHLRAPDKLAGRKAKCPKCGGIIPVPAAQSGGSPFDDALSQQAAKPAGAPALPNEAARGDEGSGSAVLIVAGAAAVLLISAVVAGVFLFGMLRNDSAAPSPVVVAPLTMARPEMTEAMPAPEPAPEPEPAVNVAPPEPEPQPDPNEHNPGLVMLTLPDPTVPTATSEAEPPVDVAAVFGAQFGKEVFDAEATAAPDDDIELASRILDAAGERGLALPVAVFMLEKAYELAGRGANGYKIAARATRRLTRYEPTRKQELIERLVALSEKYYGSDAPGAPQAGDLLDRYLELAAVHLQNVDGHAAEEALAKAAVMMKDTRHAPVQEIKDRQAEAALQIKRQVRIDELKATLAAKPEDKEAAGELVAMYVYELDRPERAVPYVDGMGDAVVAKHVKLATRPPRDLNERELLDLGHWYGALGHHKDTPNRPGMCIRARMYYEQYLAKHVTQDEERLATLAAKNELDGVLGKLGVGMKLARRKVKHLRQMYGEVVIRPDVRLAIDHALAWLYDQQIDETRWEEDTEKNRNHRDFGGRTALVAYAMTMAEETPRTSAPLRNAINWLFSQRLSGTYATCFRMHLWETLEENPMQRKVAQADAARMYASAHPDGSMDYYLDKRENKPGDLSTVLAGYLTLWLGETNGMKVADQGWPRISRRLLDEQSSQGMWPYRPERAPTATMTAAGLTVLLMALDQNHLDEDEELRQQVAVAVDRGMYWLDTHYTPEVTTRWPTYYFAAMQHVGLLSGRRDLNGRNWYDWTADYLLAKQNSDGSWGDVVETAFAVIFLARGGNAYDAAGE